MSVTSSTSSSPRSEGGDKKKEPSQNEELKEIVAKSLPSPSANAETSTPLTSERITSKFQPDHPTTKICEFIAKCGDKFAKKTVSNFRNCSPEENAKMLKTIYVLKILRLPPDGLPEEIDLLTRLSSLSLIALNLTSLPNSITNLKELDYLSLQGNNFTELPKHLVEARLNGQLPDLTYINLNGNRNIKWLPLELIKDIQYLDAPLSTEFWLEWEEWKDMC